MNCPNCGSTEWVIDRAGVWGCDECGFLREDHDDLDDPDSIREPEEPLGHLELDH